MPIHRTLNLQTVSDDDFQRIDEAVMRCAYASQNNFGRLFDERIYENDVAARLRAEGFEVHTQVPVMVTHLSFAKTYYLDLVVNNMLYELKVTSTLTKEHEAQGLHYAMLQDTQRVKLINFGTPKVQGRLFRNALTEAHRHHPTMRNSGWKLLTPNCNHLINALKEVIKDWGTHLDSLLYNEFLVHHFGGETECLQRIEIKDHQINLGTHPVQLHAPGHAFVVTAFHEPQFGYQQHLQTLLKHAPLDGIQWINLNHSRLEITTLQK